MLNGKLFVAMAALLVATLPLGTQPLEVAVVKAGLQADHPASRGLVDLHAARGCGMNHPCQPVYDLVAVNASASAPPDDGAQAEFRRRRHEARKACRAAHEGESPSPSRRANGTFVAQGQAVLQTGGWCLDMSKTRLVTLPRRDGSHVSYEIPPFHGLADAWVVTALVHLVTPSGDRTLAASGWPRCGVRGGTVSDFGAGVGSYMYSVHSEAPGVAYRAYDGAGNIDEATGGAVRWFDLTLPLAFPRSDWVISLEVGEHVPPMFEGMVLRNLHAHNCRGIVLSWARLRQRGHGHVNNHMPDYLAKKLHALGYFVNENITYFLQTGRQRDPEVHPAPAPHHCLTTPPRLAVPRRVVPLTDCGACIAPRARAGVGASRSRAGQASQGGTACDKGVFAPPRLANAHGVRALHAGASPRLLMCGLRLSTTGSSCGA